MSWEFYHRSSENLAVQAHEALRMGASSAAASLFWQAADAEENALSNLNPTEKSRTFGITAVSAVSLWYKAKEFSRAAHVAYKALSVPSVPVFAEEQLRELLQIIWNEEAQTAAGLHFARQQVLISVKGGQIVSGGAPLDLVVDKVQTVQSLFYRTVEHLKKLPLRKKGPPTKDIQELCRPWLFQSVPGSYQFAVTIEGPKQLDMLEDNQPDTNLITYTFLSILQRGADDPSEGLIEVVPDRDYRATFLKLTRNLAPSGRVFTQLEVRASGDDHPIVLSPDSRRSLTQTLRSGSASRSGTEKCDDASLSGVLRAVHLDDDWLEVSVDGHLHRVIGVGDTVDDVIGPLVNHQVTVFTMVDARGKHRYRDIELDE